MLSKKINIRSEEVEELLSKPPSWLLRWGTLCIGAAIAALFFVVWWIKYPEVISAPIVLSSETAPVVLVARTSGRLEKLLVADRQKVSVGQRLILLQNTADYDDVMRLDNILNELQSGEKIPKNNYLFSKKWQLGDIQGEFSELLQNMSDYDFLTTEKFDISNSTQLNEQITIIQKGIEKLQDLEKINRKDYELAQKRFKDSQKLYADGILKQYDLEDAKKEEYAKEKELKILGLNILEKQKEVEQLQAKKLIISQSKSENDNSKRSKIRESIRRLEGKLAEWKQNYLLSAPAAGVVSFYNFRAEQQNIKSGDELLAIIPDSSQLDHRSDMVGRIYLPSAGSSKVKSGQRAVIKLENYPFQEYGILDGKVESKSLLPKNNQYFIKVILPNGLKTSFQKEIIPEQQLMGFCDIVIENKRLSDRILEKLFSIFFPSNL